MTRNLRYIVLVMLFLVGCGGSNPVEPEPVKTKHEEGDLIVDLPNGEKMAFMWIEPGTFMMGTLQSEFDALTRDLIESITTTTIMTLLNPEIPQHPVTLTKGFYLGKYEVTVGQWTSVMGKEGVYTDEADFPVNEVFFRSVEAFIDSLNQMDEGAVYRLPTEAEWEYAARAGTATTWWFGSWDELESGELGHYDFRLYTGANILNPQLSELQEVGLTTPNPWGLYDMDGNVGEWVLEGALREFSSEPQIDPVGPDEGFIELPLGYTEAGYLKYMRYDHIHLFRGAPSPSQRRWMRPAYRGVYRELDIYGTSHIGFRLVRERK